MPWFFAAAPGSCAQQDRKGPYCLYVAPIMALTAGLCKVVIKKRANGVEMVDFNQKGRDIAGFNEISFGIVDFSCCEAGFFML